MSRKNVKADDTRLAQPDFTSLTPRQQRFIEAYIADPSPKNAAIAAGYSARSAYVAGHNLLKLEKIAGEISRRRMASLAATQAAQDLNLELVIKELRRLAFSDIRRVIRWGMKGKTWKRKTGVVGEKAKEEHIVLQAAEMIPSWELDDDIAAAVQKVFIGADGRIRIELYDKIEPLQTLGRHLGLRGSAASIGRIGDNILNAGNGAPGAPLPPVDLSRLPMAKLKELDEWLAEISGSAEGEVIENEPNDDKQPSLEEDKDDDKSM